MWLMNLVRDIYQESDCRYGYRKITQAIKNKNYNVNHKKVLKVMQELSIQGLYPNKYKTTTKGKTKVFPYLLQDLKIIRKNQVWATDITYIKLPKLVMYFTAIIDLYSRYIISYSLSNTLATDFCMESLIAALKIACPDIFNTDQGCQYTSHAFTGLLLDHNIQISMDHKGRCFDNIIMERFWRTFKQEGIYFYRPENIKELEIMIPKLITWYNYERLHQSLKYLTPAQLYYN
jgi:putative transposase